MAKLTNIIMVIGIVAILLIMINMFPVKEEPIQNNFGEAKKFSSLQELKDFLKTKQSEGIYYSGFGMQLLRSGAVTMGLAEDAAAPTGGGAKSSTDFSQTNIQVQGVDEADIVKNDGKYLYIVSGEKITIIDAYPADQATILSNLDIKGIADEIFINENKLVVFGREKYSYEEPMPLAEPVQGVAKIASTSIYPYYSQKSFIKVYDIADKENPSLDKEITYEGDYYDSRMINNYVYAIVNQPINYRDDDIVMPLIKDGAVTSAIMPENIYYFDMPDYNYRLTTIFALNLDDNNLEKANFLTGYTQTIFVSQENIYLTSQKQISYIDYQKKLFEETYVKLVDASTASQLKDAIDNKDYNKVQELLEEHYNKLSQNERDKFQKDLAEKMQDVEAEIQKEIQKTIVHKISINKDEIKYLARGEVPGTVLNQFSMDEYQGNFRIATTTGDLFSGSSLNHMYVLDENLDTIGRLEDLGYKEKIYSVRFIDERAYMVTFKKIDPLFVIDLSNPENPRVLGELKIPGYSDYLHPYDANHIIGIGKEAVDAGDNNRDFAWYQGVKLSLFDVSDVNNPKEISKFNIGDRGTDSEALYEHKAFLFDKEKELLVIPISLHEIDESKYPNGVQDSTYGELVYEGAYVLSLNLEDGFKLKGRVTHLSNEELSNLGGERYYYPDYQSKIRRSLYMDNVLYTVSSKFVKANDLNDLQEIKTIELPFKQEDYPIIY